MPEGPEVRTIADKLSVQLVKQVILNVWISPELAVAVTGNLYDIVNSTVTMVASYGKKLLIHFNNGLSLVAGLGMTGRFLYQPAKHSQIGIQYTSQAAGEEHIPHWVFFEDIRHFGHIDICQTTYLPTLLHKMGPDLLAAALTTELSFETWISRFPTSSVRKIFDVIKDQSTVSGIGNYLASEILYYSAIHPLRLTKSLTASEWEKLRQVSHQIIKLSYCYGGFTLDSFISPDGSIGLYPAAVYGKTSDSQNNMIVKVKIGSQSAYLVPAVQLIAI